MDVFPYGLNSQYPGSDVEDIFEFFDDVKTSLKMFLMMVKTSLKKFFMMVKTLFKKLSSDKISGLKCFVEKKERRYLVIKVKEVKIVKEVIRSDGL